MSHQSDLVKQFPPHKAPSPYFGDYTVQHIKPSKLDRMELKPLAMGCLVAACLIVFVLAIGLFALVVKN